MKKKILAALISGVMLITSLTACSGGTSSTPDSASSGATVSEETSSPTHSDVSAVESSADTSVDSSADTSSAESSEPVDIEPIPDDIAPLDFAKELMPGWNLGNQREANSGGTPSETAWGNPTITEELIKAVKAAGFKTVRIPVSYLSKIGEDNTVDAEWLDRVAEVVDMCVNNGLYAIINMHGDGYHTITGGWLFCDADANEQDAITAKYKAVWEQIAERFKDYDCHLIFESMNEEFDGTYGAINNEAYENINVYNQIFVDTVRAAGGNNAKRFLLVPGWNTDINATTENETFKVPTDDAGRVMVSVHYYDPYDFTINEKAKGIIRWGIALKGQNKKTTWGDEDYVDGQFDKLSDKFISKGIPVIIGEYGTMDKSSFDERNTTYRAYWTEYINYAAAKRGIVTVLWDNGFNGVNGMGVFDRYSYEQTQPEIISAVTKGISDTDAPEAPTE